MDDTEKGPSGLFVPKLTEEELGNLKRLLRDLPYERPTLLADPEPPAERHPAVEGLWKIVNHIPVEGGLYETAYLKLKHIARQHLIQLGEIET